MHFITTFSTLAALLLASALPASAAGQGHGRVRMNGRIVDTACAIAAGDRNQVISISTVPADQLLLAGHGMAIPFELHLVNCVLTGGDPWHRHRWKDVRITFEGIPDEGGRFAIGGTARGEALVIEDMQGHRAVPGQSMPATPLSAEGMILRYNMRLEADGKPLRPGTVNGAVRFFMDYD